MSYMNIVNILFAIQVHISSPCIALAKQRMILLYSVILDSFCNYYIIIYILLYVIIYTYIHILEHVD